MHYHVFGTMYIETISPVESQPKYISHHHVLSRPFSLSTSVVPTQSLPLTIGSSYLIERVNVECMALRNEAAVVTFDHKLHKLIRETLGQCRPAPKQVENDREYLTRAGPKPTDNSRYSRTQSSPAKTRCGSSTGANNCKYGSNTS